MKTNIVLLLGVILFGLLAGQVAEAQPRGAVWVHGLGDDSEQWDNWANQFTGSRQLFSRNRLGAGTESDPWTDYQSQNGVTAMANNVRNSYGAAPDNRAIYFWP